MPFETSRTKPLRIAVIGGGISGMGAAHRLGQNHHVTLFEAEARLGGHARTIMAGAHRTQPVDTGFVVFNYANYPNLAELFDELAVPVAKSNMSFGASINGGQIEYGLASLSALFAQRRNIANPAFLRMVRDIMHFNKHGLRFSNDNPDWTIGQLLERLGTGRWFRDYYLTPFSGAIWSTPTDKILDFPAQTMMQFFDNHNLLGVQGQHQWYTVQGGSQVYVARLETRMREMGVDIRLKAPVAAVERHPGEVRIKTPQGDWESYDEVIFATHSDDSLKMLADPSKAEQRILGAIKYQPNDVVLHSDAAMMPKRRVVWSSWVYTEAAETKPDRIGLTYWMNSLQPIPANDPYFVTLNTTRAIREELIHDQVTLRHPVYDLKAIAAQEEARWLNGEQNTWFCGAWMRNGFHEDGLASALEVAEELTRRASVQVAAE